MGLGAVDLVFRPVVSCISGYVLFLHVRYVEPHSSESVHFLFLRLPLFLEKLGLSLLYFLCTNTFLDWVLLMVVQRTVIDALDLQVSKLQIVLLVV